MDRRKELLKEYKDRKVVGGVYKITNEVSGKYVIDHTPNLQSMQNHFQFAQKMGNPMHLKLKSDWAALGGQAFKLEVLEELEQGSNQSQTQFVDDLKALEQLWRANFDSSQEY